MRYSACLEMLFVPESANFVRRIALARDAGLEAFEFWRWIDKDIDAVETAVKATGMAVAGLVAEPMVPLTDPARHSGFLEGLEKSIGVAQRLGARVLIAQAGDDLPGRTRQEQRAAIQSCLVRAADVLHGTGVKLAIEPLNTLVDHPGYFLHSTHEALDIVDAVGRPGEIGILYDLYHSMMMGEVAHEVLAGRVDRIVHIHVADHPGRHQPGTGSLPLKPALQWLYANGYTGRVGLEYVPTGSSIQSLNETRAQLES